MSYARWSTQIQNAIPWDEYVRLTSKERKVEQEKRGTVISDWYIFYHCNSGDTLDEQLLALWHCRDANSPLFDYPMLREAYDNDTWPLDIISQKEYMRSCVKEWLDEVEAEYKDKVNV